MCLVVLVSVLLSGLQGARLSPLRAAHRQSGTWQQLLEQKLMPCGNLANAAMIGHNGGTWATTTKFSLKTQEGQKIASLLASEGPVPSTTITVGGTTYRTLSSLDSKIIGKSGSSGVIIVKTKQAIVIGVYASGHIPGKASVAVQDFASNLISQGY